MKKKSVIIRESYVPMFETATDEQVGKLVKAMLKYQQTGEAELSDPMMAAVFAMIKEGIDQDNEEYEATCKRRRDAANKRWGNDPCNSMQEHASACNSMREDADMDMDMDTQASKDAGVKRGARFKPPTRDEVAAYCRSRSNRVDPDAFVNFYAAKGWKVGNQGMKDWQAAVRTWERRDKSPVVTAPPGRKVARFELQRDTDYVEIERKLRQAQRGKADG